MIVPVDIRDLILFIGIGNGILMASYLLGNRERTLAQVLLGLLIVCMSFNVCIFLILKYGLYNQYPILHWLPFGLSFTIGPLLYFYTKAVISKSFKITKSGYKHFLLLLLDYPHSIYHIIYGRTVLHLDLHYVLDKFALFSMISNAIYLFLTYKAVKEYNKQLPNYASNTRNLQLKWLGNSIFIWTGLFVFGLVYGAIDFILDLNFEEAYFINYLLIATVLWLGIKGTMQGQNSMELSRQITQSLPAEKGEKIIKDLKQLMKNQKIYLYPDLTLRNVEDQLNFSSKEISLAINSVIKKNFYQFINEYRVEEFKLRVLDKKNKHLTLFGIAQESGFNSKATFNRVFSSVTGISPRQFLDQSNTQ